MSNVDPNVNVNSTNTVTSNTSSQAGTEIKKKEKVYTDDQKAGMEELHYLLKDELGEEVSQTKESEIIDQLVTQEGEEILEEPDKLSLSELKAMILNADTTDETTAAKLESLKNRLESDKEEGLSEQEIKTYLSDLGLKFGEDDSISITELTALLASFKTTNDLEIESPETSKEQNDLKPELTNLNYVTAVIDTLMGIENNPELDLETEATGVQLAEVISEEILTKDEDGNLTNILSDLGEALFGYGKDLAGEDYSDILARNKNIFLAMALQTFIEEDEDGTNISQEKIEEFKQEYVIQGAKNVKFENGQISSYTKLNAEGLEEFVEITGRDENGITSMLIKNSQENPTSIVEMTIDPNSKEMVISKQLTNIKYNDFNQQISHTLTTSNGITLDISNIKYESNDTNAKLVSFTQTDSNGITKNMAVTYDQNGNPTVTEIKSNNNVTNNNTSNNTNNILNKLPDSVNSNNNLANIIALLLGDNQNNLSGQNILVVLLLGILSALQNLNTTLQENNETNDIWQNLENLTGIGPMGPNGTRYPSDPMMYPHHNHEHMCKPTTPWWQAEQNISDTASVLASKINNWDSNTQYTGNYAADASADYIASQIFSNSGQYNVLNATGCLLVNLGYAAGARNQEEAIKFGLQQLDFNQDGIIQFPEIENLENNYGDMLQTTYEGQFNLNSIATSVMQKNNRPVSYNSSIMNGNSETSRSADLISNIIFTPDAYGINRLNENGQRMVEMGRQINGGWCDETKAIELALGNLDYNKDGLINLKELQKFNPPSMCYLNAFEGTKNMNDLTRTVISRNNNYKENNKYTYTNNYKANISADYISDMIYTTTWYGKNVLNDNGKKLVQLGRSLAGYNCSDEQAMELAIKHMDFNKNGLMEASELQTITNKRPFSNFLKNWRPF